VKTFALVLFLHGHVMMREALPTGRFDTIAQCRAYARQIELAFDMSGVPMQPGYRIDCVHE
jgi:hypothetical protein